jgi:hypothetical protein
MADASSALRYLPRYGDDEHVWVVRMWRQQKAEASG